MEEVIKNPLGNEKTWLQHFIKHGLHFYLLANEIQICYFFTLKKIYWLEKRILWKIYKIQSNLQVVKSFFNQNSKLLSSSYYLIL